MSTDQAEVVPRNHVNFTYSDPRTAPEQLQSEIFIPSELARVGNFTCSERFVQQITFLYCVQRNFSENSSTAQHGINELRAQIHRIQNEIEKIKTEFWRWTGSPYYADRDGNDRATVRKFDEQRGPQLSKLMSQQDALNSRIATAESNLESQKAQATPVGILLNAITAFFNVQNIGALLPGVVPGQLQHFPDVMAGDRRRKKLDGIQDDLSKLILERNALQNASVPKEEFKRRMIERLAGSRLGYRVTALYPHTPSHIDFDAPLSLRDLAQIMGAEQVADSLYEISSSYQATYAPVGVQECKTRLKELDAKILSFGKSEEREVLALFDAGVFVSRRETADPAVLVDVWMNDGA